MNNTAQLTISLLLSCLLITNLNIIPTGMNLKVTSAELVSPNDSSTTTITCHVGIKRLVNSPLTLTVIPTQDNASVAYQLA